MKKFLPLIIFIVVFVTVLAGQVGYKFLSKNNETIEQFAEYVLYEEHFLNSTHKTLDGKEIKSTEIKAPIVIYNFWASWCMPCLEEMPSMVAMKKKFSDDEINILAVNTDEENQRQNIAKTLKNLKITNEFIIIPDQNGELVNQYNVTAIPVTIVFHRGKVIHYSQGPMDFNSEEFLEKLRTHLKS
jgi:thiol-disulfide isomerase/thioredoxin